jgi:hypothetical protein
VRLVTPFKLSGDPQVDLLKVMQLVELLGQVVPPVVVAQLVSAYQKSIRTEVGEILQAVKSGQLFTEGALTERRFTMSSVCN